MDLQNSNPIICLEAGATHGGNLRVAKELIDASVDADCIKFQTVWANNLALYRVGTLTFQDSSGNHERPMLDMLHEREMDWDEWEELDRHAWDKSLPLFTTPDAPKTARTLGNPGWHMCALKVAGSDMGRLDLIQAIAATGRRVLLDTKGGQEDLDNALEACAKFRDDTIIVHSPTGYPTTDPHLTRITALKIQYPNHVIGFTSHSPGIEDCVKAVQAGAGYIEKGISLDRRQAGIEQMMCLEPSEVAGFVSAIREAARLYG